MSAYFLIFIYLGVIHNQWSYPTRAVFRLVQDGGIASVTVSVLRAVQTG